MSWVKLPNRASKLDPVWSETRTVVETPPEHKATLDDGTTWNNVKLPVDSGRVAGQTGGAPRSNGCWERHASEIRTSPSSTSPFYSLLVNIVRLDGRRNVAFGCHMISTPSAGIQSDWFLLSYSPHVVLIIPITWFSSDSRQSPSQSVITHFLDIDSYINNILN